jgi:hypothetical protein
MVPLKSVLLPQRLLVVHSPIVVASNRSVPTLAIWGFMLMMTVSRIVAQVEYFGLREDAAAKTAYLLFASDNNQNFKIAQMDTNYYTLTKLTATLSGTTLEAPGIIKKSGKYYLFASHTSGWAPNPNKYFTATVRNPL